MASDATSIGQRIVREAWRLTPQRALSELIGFLGGLSLPRGARGAAIGAFARHYDIDVSESEKDPNEYASLNDFFTRRLKDGVRPLDPDPAALLAPADGRVVARGDIGPRGLIEAKNISIQLADLIGDADTALRLAGGSFHVTYLSPRDCHRVYVPARGRVVSSTHVPGDLFPVNESSAGREPRLFTRNERFVGILEGEVGRFAVIMVAAVGVGHITASFDPEVATHRRFTGAPHTRVYPRPVTLGRGDEFGIFHLGSTAIIIFEPGKVIFDPVSQGAPVRLGTRIGRLASAP
jgi:phosphatidylserine decarboxylase